MLLGMMRGPNAAGSTVAECRAMTPAVLLGIHKARAVLLIWSRNALHTMMKQNTKSNNVTLYQTGGACMLQRVLISSLTR